MQAWTGAIVVAVTLGAATICGLALRRRSGRFRAAADEAFTGTADASAPDPVLVGLGVVPGEVTLLQFSTAFCGPCRATRVRCAEVARAVPGVRHLEVDAESHLEAVRALGIWRTPTVLVVDAAGAIAQRATGAPTTAQLLGVIGTVLPRTELSSAPSAGVA